MMPEEDGNRVPLLEGDPSTSGHEAVPEKDSHVRISWLEELGELLRLAAPACLQLCAQQALVVASQALVGHIGPGELAAASIGVTWFNLWYYFLLGVTSALDTLGAQAYGAADEAAVIVWGFCCAIVLAILACVMAVAMWFSPVVARILFRQPYDISLMVGTYCRWMIPSLWPFVWAIAIMKTMQAQNVMWVPANATAFVCVANVGITWGLIQLFGFNGACAATTVSRALLFVILAGYAMMFGTGQRKERSARGSDADETELLKGKSLPTVPEEAGLLDLAKASARPGLLLKFLTLGLPGAIMMSADASSFDVTTAFSGLLSTVAVDAHTIMLTLCVFLFISFPFGVATASTIRVGNLLGAGRPQTARASGILCIITGTLFLSTCGVLLYTLRWRIGSWFVDDPEVQAAVASISLPAALYQFPDGILGTAGGVLRGMGRQAEIMCFNLAGFWGTGVPLGYYFTFVLKRGIVGLWWGIFTGVCVTATLCTIALLITNWDREAEKAKQWAAQEEKEAQASAQAADSCIEAGPPPVVTPAALPLSLSRTSLQVSDAMMVRRPSLQRASFFSHTNVAHGVSYPSSLPKGSAGSHSSGPLMGARVHSAASIAGDSTH